MLGSLLTLLGLALLDSVNPSALAMTLYLLTTGARAGRVLTYIAAVFVTYFIIGLGLMLGLGALLSAFQGVFETTAAYIVQAVIGAAMLIYSFSPNKKAQDGEEIETKAPRSQGFVATLLLGVTITAAEFPTAFPYFGAIGILNSLSLSFSGWLSLLLGYNLIFVTPPLLLFGAYRIFGGRHGAWFRRYEKRLKYEARETMLWIVGIVGVLLLADALNRSGVFGLFPSRRRVQYNHPALSVTSNFSSNFPAIM